MPGHQKNSEKKNSISNMVVIIYCYIGCEDEVTTTAHIETRTKRTHDDVDIFNVIQKVQDTLLGHRFQRTLRLLDKYNIIYAMVPSVSGNNLVSS